MSSTSGRATPSGSTRRCGIRRRRTARRSSRCASCRSRARRRRGQCRGPAPRGERRTAEDSRARAEAVVERRRSFAARSKQDPSFEVSTLVQASKGLEVRAGSPPGALTADALRRLRRRAHRRARRAARVRGRGAAGVRATGGAGPWSSLPDRRPSGALSRPSSRRPQFDEVLVENAIEWQPATVAIVGAPLRASSSPSTGPACPAARRWRAWIRERASRTRRAIRGARVARRRGTRALLGGHGRVALSRSGRRWVRAVLAGADRRRRAGRAGARWRSPSRPGSPVPARTVAVRARIRPTEFEDGAGPHDACPRSAPASSAADGAEHAIRLWPTAEPGVLEGRFEARPRAATICRSAPRPARPSMRS